MLDSANLDHRVDKSAYQREELKLRDALLHAQDQHRKRAVFLEVILRVQQRVAQFEFFALIRGFVDVVIEVG